MSDQVKYEIDITESVGQENNLALSFLNGFL